MGMFDYLLHEGKIYQTKNLERLLNTYSIKNGRLVYDKGHYEEIAKVEDNSFVGLFGNLKFVVDVKDYDVCYHGIINFYRLEEDNKTWIEYEAKFTNGDLVGIKKHEPTSI